MRTRLILATICLLIGCTRLSAVEISQPNQPQAPAVVFDIDGTLTPGVARFTQVRSGAAQAVQRYAAKGCKVIYLSARVNFLRGRIPDWLKKNGFPAGSLHVRNGYRNRENVAAFKARILKEYSARGWNLVDGYGDSSTDFEAYADAGIPKDHVFALLRRGDNVCQSGEWQSCLKDWRDHLSYIDTRCD